RITFEGYADLGSDINNPQGGALNTFEVADTLTQIHGKHSFAYGFDIRPIKRGNFRRDRTIRSEYDFSGVTTGTLVVGGIQRNLTLNFGVRYEYGSLVTDKNNHFSNLDFSSTACGSRGAILVAGTSAATVECPQLSPVTGTLTFVPVGTKNFGTKAQNRALQY